MVSVQLALQISGMSPRNKFYFLKIIPRYRRRFRYRYPHVCAYVLPQK